MSEFLTAKNAVLAAGQRIMEIYTHQVDAELKDDGSPVTLADKEAHRIIMASLAKSHPIISEEQMNCDPKPDCWIVDPLDGTKDFLMKNGDFAVMIGLLKSRVPVLGVVYLPARQVLYYAQKGKGAFRDDLKGKPVQLHTSSREPAIALVSRNHRTDKDAAFVKFLALKERTMGSIGVKLTTIAQGDADMYWNHKGLSIWDICAPQVILEEAGGTVVDGHGNSLVYDRLRFENGIFAMNRKDMNIMTKAIAFRQL